MYSYTKENNKTGHLSLLLSCLSGVLLTNTSKITLNSKVYVNYFACSLRTITAFMLLNMLVP